MRKTASPEFVIDMSEGPFICLPADLPRGNLVDISTLNCAWRIYFDTSTGVTHDCLVYYNKHLQLMGLPPEV